MTIQIKDLPSSCLGSLQKTVFGFRQSEGLLDAGGCRRLSRPTVVFVLWCVTQVVGTLEEHMRQHCDRQFNQCLDGGGGRGSLLW